MRLQEALLSLREYNAIFVSNSDSGKEYTHDKRVVLWTEDGGLVMSDGGHQGRGLRQAESYDNFKYYDESLDQLVGVLPAPPGWWILWPEDEEHCGDGRNRSPIIGWLVKAEGYTLEALTTPDSNGHSEPVTFSHGTEAVYDPLFKPSDGNAV